MIQNINLAEFDTTMEVVIYKKSSMAAVHLEKICIKFYGE
jgi:hypothetical protein